MSAHDLFPHRESRATDAAEPDDLAADDGLEHDDRDEPTIPNTRQDGELLEAIEWLRSAGIVSDEKPPFSRFFDELAENTDTGRRNPTAEKPAGKKQVG